VVRDYARFVFGSVQPSVGETDARAAAAAAWLLRAQAATPDDGGAQGDYPCSRDGGDWKPSYLETTGYIITSLLAYAQLPRGRRAPRRCGWPIGKWRCRCPRAPFRAAP
jgi:hypothetical protein